ncbi:MAG: isoprenylcysteine carboxylmethyltransferase family protein [Hyphomonadaceae bacterium]
MLRSIPPPLWAALFLAFTYWLGMVLPFAQDLPEWRHKPAGAILIAAALALLFASMGHFFFAKTQLLPTSPVNNKLVTGGVFALTRNPMYLAMTLVSLGVAVWMGQPLMYMAPLGMFVVANWIFIPFEEEKMRRQFGDAFDAYCKRVRRWI